MLDGRVKGRSEKDLSTRKIGERWVSRLESLRNRKVQTLKIKGFGRVGQGVVKKQPLVWMVDGSKDPPFVDP